MEISPFTIKCEYIKGIKHTSAHTVSRLNVMDPGNNQEPEPPGHEFGYCVFEHLQK